MKLTERLNVLIQAATLSQKGGILTFDEASKAKTAIDVISAGTITQNFPSAINVLIEIAVSSQKKGVYSLKDAYMIYLAIEGIETEFQNEVNRMNNVGVPPTAPAPVETPNVVENNNNQNDENVITIPPKKSKKKS